MLLLCNAPPGVKKTMPVSSSVSVSVIDLIIDASIPAAVGLAARNAGEAKWEGRAEEERGGEEEEEEGGNGGLGANKRRHLEGCSCSALPEEDTRSVNCDSHAYKHTHS